MATYHAVTDLASIDVGPPFHAPRHTQWQPPLVDSLPERLLSGDCTTDRLALTASRPSVGLRSLSASSIHSANM